jgi:tetratricopeptide (TPR) repeat protein
MRPIAVLSLVLALLVATAVAPAGRAQSAIPAQPLGTFSFPTSGSPRAQADFLRGVAWLHSFGYEEAIDAFRAAQKLDPGFVMAYWGEALAFSQPLWFNEEPEKARAALLKLGPSPQARASKATTPREAAYLKAVEALYAPGDRATRARNYADAMAGVVKQFPEDDEAKAFLALAVLGTMPRGDAALPIRRQAGALAEGVFARNPKHPGAAHYILHAYDHGDLAAKALPAARAYARIAPAASHALHMPAHAFLQLGLWAEAAATDQNSWDASVAWAKRRGASAALYDFHSLAWLQYEWTQLGKFGAALGAIARIDEALAVIKPSDAVGGHHYGDSEIGRGSGPLTLRNDKGSMRARYIVESERWREMRGQTTFDNVDELFALGLASVRLKDLPRAEAALNELRKASGPAQHPELREQAAVMTREMDALLLIATGQQDLGFQAMMQAVELQKRMPRPIGRPYPVKGADELFGEVMLEAGRAVEAKAWFEAALRRTPNRSRAVLGLARATARLGEKAASRKAYAQFLDNWKSADAGLPEIAEAKKALGAR